uniref:Glycoside hydrolase n=1 Tax=viral metagenome TaxID=1070528 RepID=A0A6M3JB85_9ZZZZ
MTTHGVLGAFSLPDLPHHDLSPPRGAWLLGIGSPLGDDQDVLPLADEYALKASQAAGGDGHRPALVGCFLDVPGHPLRWEAEVGRLDAVLGYCEARGLALNLGVAMVGADGQARDREIADGMFAPEVDEVVGRLAARPGVLAYLRIGVEVNRPGLYHAGALPDAWRVVRARVPNSAGHVRAAWCVDPSGFDPWEGDPKDWVPRLDEVQVWSVDLFDRDHFAPVADPTLPGTAASRIVSSVLRSARAARRRVLIGESSPVLLGATSPGWWGPLLDLLSDSRDVLEAVTLLPVDWTGTKWDAWGNARYQDDQSFLRDLLRSVDLRGAVHAPPGVPW